MEQEIMGLLYIVGIVLTAYVWYRIFIQPSRVLEREQENETNKEL